MADIAVAARDLDTGYEKGDLISILPDGWEWGTLDTLPNIWKISISGLPTAAILHLPVPLDEPAFPGDRAFEETDEADRIILRGRAKTRLMWAELPGPWLFDLDLTGQLEVHKNQLRPFFRQLRYNRGSARVEKTTIEVI